jgi:hypothetical protein
MHSLPPRSPLHRPKSRPASSGGSDTRIEPRGPTVRARVPARRAFVPASRPPARPASREPGGRHPAPEARSPAPALQFPGISSRSPRAANFAVSAPTEPRSPAVRPAAQPPGREFPRVISFRQSPPPRSTGPPSSHEAPRPRRRPFAFPRERFFSSRERGNPTRQARFSIRAITASPPRRFPSSREARNSSPRRSNASRDGLPCRSSRSTSALLPRPRPLM